MPLKRCVSAFSLRYQVLSAPLRLVISSRTAAEGASELMRRKVAYALRSSSQNVSHTYVYLHASLRNLRTSKGVLGPTCDLQRSRQISL